MKILSSLTLLLVLFVSNAHAESLMGQVLNRRGFPVGGMEVRLFHPGPGLSRSRYTDRNGFFYFDYVPPVGGSYDIEYYWKGQLIYRGPVTVRGNTQLPPIRL